MGLRFSIRITYFVFLDTLRQFGGLEHTEIWHRDKMLFYLLLLHCYVRLLEPFQRKGAVTAVRYLGCSLYFKVTIAFVKRISEFCLATVFLKEIMT